MDDSIEADLLAAHHLSFSRDPAAWIDCYVTARSRLAPSLSAAAVVAAASRAWRSNGWAHPAVLAHLEHELGPFADD
jgi:hypothetical protein